MENTKKGYIGIAQINPTAGDIEHNSIKIKNFIIQAQKMNLDLVVFPELCLVGYPLWDITDKYPFILEENIKWLEELAKITKSTTAVIGFAEPAGGVKYYNSAAIISNGKIQKIIRKISPKLTPLFNDFKYFEPAQTKNENIIEINGIKYSICIGEDINNDLAQKTDVIINCNALSSLSDNDFSQIAIKYNTPTIFVNQVGTTDNITFEGASKVFDKNGKLIAGAKSFEEQLLVVNPLQGIGKIYSDTHNTNVYSESFSLDYEFDMERTYKTIVQGIKDYFNKNGLKRAVLGLSGGLDSTVCAVLLADALGAENVYGVSMPSKITSNESKSDAELLANNLGINFTQAPIIDMFETTNKCFEELFKTIETNWQDRYKKPFTKDNIQARSRAIILWGISNEFPNAIPIATSDKSEAYMGYATINGDMSGGFAPIADVTKTKLFALARWLNKNRTIKNAIPESIILKRPGAELAIDPKTGKPLIAEDALMPYEFLDEAIWRIENKKENYQDMLNSEFLYETTHQVSKEQKTQWLDKFYKRMAGALYKKSIMPPYVIVDTISPTSIPISSKVDYKGKTTEEIKEILSL